MDDHDAASAENGFDYNQLNQLGNRAIALGLIIGHGHHAGKYEILSRQEVLLLSPREAYSYLQALIKQAEPSHD